MARDAKRSCSLTHLPLDPDAGDQLQLLCRSELRQAWRRCRQLNTRPDAVDRIRGFDRCQQSETTDLCVTGRQSKAGLSAAGTMTP